ncbi:hypothetical protein [Microcoleus sp. FACHB-SPT15]|nr:hypothetical protein [Microcoleus sp. FACHB-SPT15]
MVDAITQGVALKAIAQKMRTSTLVCGFIPGWPSDISKSDTPS